MAQNNSFSALAHHDERDPVSVAKISNSKRAIKRLQREEAERERQCSLLEQRGECRNAWETGVLAARPPNQVTVESTHAFLEEAFAGSHDIAAEVLDDIASQMSLLRCREAGPCLQGRPDGDVHLMAPSLLPTSHHQPGPGPGPTRSCASPLARFKAALSTQSSQSSSSPGLGSSCGPYTHLGGSIPSSRPSSSSTSAGVCDDFPALASVEQRTPPAKTLGYIVGRAHGGRPTWHHGARGQLAVIKVLNKSVPGGGSPREEADSDGTGPNLQLLWSLLADGMSLLQDPLIAAQQAPDGDAKAAIQRLVQAQFAEASRKEGGQAREVSPEMMIDMMAKAHRRQAGAAAAAAAAAAAPPSSAGGGAAAAQGEPDEEEDEEHLYTDKERSKDWDRTIRWMEHNDWMRVPGTTGHFKYRRLLPNGKIQTQTVSCSPSDGLRGVHNLQAALAKHDAEANEVIRQWRREQRLAQSSASQAGACG